MNAFVLCIILQLKITDNVKSVTSLITLLVWLVGQLIGRSVIISREGVEVTLPCSQRKNSCLDRYTPFFARSVNKAGKSEPSDPTPYMIAKPRKCKYILHIINIFSIISISILHLTNTCTTYICMNVQSVIISLKGGKFHFTCSYRSTCSLYW